MFPGEPMDLMQAMRVFRRVVELKGFSAAARDQRLSNAAVSKQVAALEDHLKTRLLNRTTRRVSPTTAGAAYYERCVRILDDVDDAERALSRSAAAPRGLLRLNVPMSFGLLHVAPLIPELLARYPDLKIDLSLTDRFVDLVEEGVDVVVRIAGELPDSMSLVAQKLARARHVVCGSPKYLRKHGEPRRPSDLTRFDCVVYSLGQNPGEWWFEGPQGPERVRVEGRLTVNNSLVIRQALVAGAGLSLLPAFYVGAELRSGALRAVLSEHEARSLYVFAVYQRGRHLSPKVRVVVEFLRERFAKAEWAIKKDARDD
jgi:DNA-binding transcriptional LysR family regulator